MTNDVIQEDTVHEHTHDAIASEPVPKQLRPKMVHLAVALGYVGIRYNGSQWQGPSETQPNLLTIEGELYRALEESGILHGRDIKAIGWTRCSRTDKSVSAAMAVFSFFAPLGINLSEVLQPHLPCDIALYGAARTAPKFNAKQACTSRTYEYLLPLALLLPEQLSDAEPLGAEAEAYFAYLSSVQADAVETVRDACVRLYTASRHDIADFLQLDDEFRAVRARLAAHTGPPRAAFTEVLHPYLQRLVTTAFTQRIRAYHNFTENNVQPSASSRKICSCTISPPFSLEDPSNNDLGLTVGKLFTKVTLCGQAFLMWQIRRMIGAVIAVVRGWIPATYLYLSFQTRIQYLRMPTAPGHYLLLNRPHYEHLLTKRDFSQHGTFISEDAGVQAQAEKFKTERIYPKITELHAAQVAENKVAIALKEMHYELARHESGWLKTQKLLCEDLKTQEEIARRTTVICK